MTMTNANRGQIIDYELTKDTPYLALMGELYGDSFMSILEKSDYVINRFDCK